MKISINILGTALGPFFEWVDLPDLCPGGLTCADGKILSAVSGLAGGAVNFLHFFFYLIVAAVCAGIASRIVPGIGKNGFLGSAVLGMVGGWVGTCIMGNIGPSLEGVFLVPAIVGSAAVIFLFHAVSRLFGAVSKKGKPKKAG